MGNEDPIGLGQLAIVRQLAPWIDVISGTGGDGTETLPIEQAALGALADGPSRPASWP
jgi:hypothetical protein